MSVEEAIGAILETLPVGFRFYPTEEELVDHYLKSKILGMDSDVDIIPEVDVCKWEPWELPAFSVIKTDDQECFFFSPPDYKNSNGGRSNRQTEAGYWKPTGQDRDIRSGTNKEVIGTRKTLVFYRGRGRAAVRTNWVIHQYQYRAYSASLPANRPYVLCRLKMKKDKKTGSDIPTPDEAVAGGFSREINFSSVSSELPIVQETLLMNMELNSSSTGAGIHLNGPANDMTLGAGPSHHALNIASDVGHYQVEEMTTDEDPQLQGLFNDFTSTPLDSDWFSDTEQGLDLDLPFPSGFNNSYGSMQFQDGVDGLYLDPTFPSGFNNSYGSMQFQDGVDRLCLDPPFPSGFNNSYGSMQFQDGVDTEFANSFIFDPEEFHCEGLSGQRSSAVYSENLDHGSVGRLSARPQSPLKGVYGKSGGLSSNTNTQALQVQNSVLQQASSPVQAGSKECMQSPVAQRQHATTGLSSLNQHRKENNSFLHDESRRLDNFVAQGVDPKGVKLSENVSNNEILLAKLTKLSCSMSKPEENSVSIEAKDRAEYGSATDLLQNKNPIKESKKDCKDPEKANPKLSSTARWNEPVGINKKGSFSSPDRASASHEPSSSPGSLVNLLVGIMLFVVRIADMVPKVPTNES